MTQKEFNEKYKDHLTEGFETQGLEFDILPVTEYLDKLFQQLIAEDPLFKYAQIKLKFGYVRFYTTVDMEKEFEVEDKIQDLVDEYNKTKPDDTREESKKE